MAVSKTIRTIALAALMTAGGFAVSTASWSQQPTSPRPPIPQFPIPDNFAGVAGSAAEVDRITRLCGPSRNRADGYAPAPAFAGQTKAPIVAGTQGYAVESFARIDRPWGMAFLPDGTMLISFRDGGMRIVDKTGVVSDLIANVPEMVKPGLGTGMYGVILDRKFARNRTIYFAWHTRMAGDAAPMGRVASAKLSKDEKSIGNLKILLEGADIQPRGLIQGKDGKLYVFSADVSDTGINSQNMLNQFGKVLRINTDGTVPKDNPFIGRTDVAPTVWANGYRDIHSAFVHPRTGEIWAVENVPKGGDEIDIYRKGRNYGFGIATYGRQNSGALINDGKTAQEGIEQPLYYWNPSIAPAGMLLYTGRKFPGWRNNIFVGGMSGMQVARLVMNGEKVVAEEKLLMDRCERIKVIEQGPEGDIYILTDQMPGYQNEILRLVPAPKPPAPRMPDPNAPIPTPQPGPGERPRVTPAAAAAPGDQAPGAAAFGRACATCHGVKGEGDIGPPLAGRTDAAYVATVIRDGAGAMPALAGSLSASEIDAVSKYLAYLPR